MPIVEIKFRPWTGKASLNVEVGEDVRPFFCLRAALEIVVGEIREGKRDRADLSGADLSGADLRGADLSRADLRDADLHGAILRDADLRDADLRDADLSGADLSRAILRDADLSGADLSGADLRDADLREILEKEVPLVPNLDAAVLKIVEQSKGLDMGRWHGDEECDETNWCQTTHCRAGAAICAAGKEGFALEKKYGAATAGMLLYMKSAPDLRIPNFYASNTEAMRDMRERAGFEQTASDPA